MIKQKISKNGILSFMAGLTLFSCHSDFSKKAAAMPASIPANEFTNVVLPFTDTLSPKGQQTIHSLDSLYRIEVAKGFNGSVLVGYKGHIIYERYFGVANRNTQSPLTKETASQLASTSKPFTATAILWLYQNKYLDINAPVSQYIPTFPYPDITVKMLLNQRSGLSDYTKWGKTYWKSNAIMSNSDLINLFATYKPRLNFNPDTRFQYSNSNYAMLASIVENVTKIPFREFLQTFIFTPLGMTHTFVMDVANKDAMPTNRAISYQYNWAVFPDIPEDGVVGDKNVYSTVEDMYRWDQSFYKHTLLSQQTQDLAYTGYSNEKDGIRNYGFGWRMMKFPDGYQMVFHNGWWHGNNTIFYRFIQDDFTVIVLGNKYNKGIYQQGKKIYHLLQQSNGLHNNPDWEDEGGSPKEE